MLMIENAKNYLLTQVNDLLNTYWRDACNAVLDDKRFCVWPGSIDKHHAFPCGLILHTAQVMQMALAISEELPKPRRGVLIVAALLHDYGKVWDYEPLHDTPENFGIDRAKQKYGKSAPPASAVWQKSSHYSLVRHVSRSYAEWMRLSEKLDTRDREAVGHCILAHHGRKESPVEPISMEAEVLHYADMLSSHHMDGGGKTA